MGDGNRGPAPRILFRALRTVTRRLPTLVGGPRLLRLHRRVHSADEEFLARNVLPGVSMYLRPFQLVDFHLFYGAKFYEGYEQAAFRRAVRPGMTVIDVGAYIGLYALQAARLVGPSGRVIALEPDPDTYLRLCRNIDLNPRLAPRITALKVAASDEAGVGNLSRPIAENLGSNSLAGAVDDAPRHRVDITTLDEVARTFDVDSSRCVIKIDAEGYDGKVLRGATSLLGGPNGATVFAEVSPAALRRAGDTPEAMIEVLRSRGYTVRLVDHRKPRPLTGVWGDTSNVIALPPRPAIEARLAGPA